jgi:hypothetical protein
MEIILFSLKLEDVELKFQDANLCVSSPINQIETTELIVEKLRKLNLTTDLNAVNYVIKADGIYAEGIAYEISEPVMFDFIY